MHTSTILFAKASRRPRLLNVAKSLTALLLAAISHDAYAESPATGGLAGTFAWRMEVTHMVNLPLVPDRPNSNVNYLISRVKPLEDGGYEQVSQMCRTANSRMMGTGVGVEDSALAHVPPIVERLDVDPQTGRLSTSGHWQLWGLKDEPEVYTARFPRSLDDTRKAPFSDWIIDMDNDGEKGVAMRATGLSSAHFSGIQRKRLDWIGQMVGADRIVGVISMNKESLVLRSNSRFLKAGRYKAAQSSGGADANYFEALRVPDGSDCATVIGLLESGAFVEESPF